MNEYGKCPICDMNWCGGDIPKDIHKYYAHPYKWSHLISIEVRGVYDGAIANKCPSCSSLWSRFTDKLLYTGSGKPPSSREMKEIYKQAEVELESWLGRPINEAEKF